MLSIHVIGLGSCPRVVDLLDAWVIQDNYSCLCMKVAAIGAAD